MAGHIHKEIMLRYALLAQTHEKPWEFIQGRDEECDEWEDYTGVGYLPTFNPEYKYRLKPKTININGFEVPEPLRVAPKFEVKYYYPNLCMDRVYGTEWQDTELDNDRFNNGIIYAEKENCWIYLNAILSFTKIKAQK